VFARVISDNCVQFDKIEDGYDGPLYVEISPRTFSIRVRTGSRLVQIRLRRGSPVNSPTYQRRLQEEAEVINGPVQHDLGGQGLPFTVDVQGMGPGSTIGYRARKHTALIDVDAVAQYDAADFWEPVLSRNGRGLVLDPEDFYILASRESVVVPAD